MQDSSSTCLGQIRDFAFFENQCMKSSQNSGQKKEVDQQALIRELERKVKQQAEQLEQIKFSEDKFRMLFENSLDGLWVTERDGSFDQVNQALCDMLGYSQKELVQLSREDVTIEDLNLLNALKTRQEKGSYNGIIKMRRKDGVIIDVEISSAFFKDKTGETFSYVRFKDITEKLTAERKIRQSEANLNALINSTTDAIFAIDRNYKLIALNNSFFDRGYYFAGIRFKPGDDFFNDAAGEDRRAWWRKHIEQAFAGNHFKTEERFDFEGKTYYSEISFTPIKQDNEVTGLVCFSRDITEKKQSEQRQENSEKRFRALIENSNDIISLIDAEGRMQYISPAAKTVLGYELNDRSGRDLFEHIHPDDAPGMMKMFAYVMANPGSSVKAEWRHRHKDGSWLWMEGMGTNLLHDPAVNALVNNFRDITERKVAEQKLENAASELNQIFNTVEEGLFSMDMTAGKYLHVSAGCEKIYGYPISEFFANPQIWFDVIHLDDKAMVNVNREKIRSGEHVTMQFRINHKEQSIRWVETKIIPTLNESGVIIRVDGIVKDITDKKEAEEKLELNEQRFRSLIEKGNDGIIISAEEKIIYASPSIKAIIGYEADTLIGKNPYTLMDTMGEGDVKRLIDFMRETPGESISFQHRWKHKDGTWRWLDCTVTNQLAVDGVNGIVSNFRDITDRKNAEDELQTLNQMLEKNVADRTAQLNEANKMLESFSFSVAHDLQAPLRILKGYAEILTNEHNEQLNTEGHRLLSVIMNYAGLMSQLISDLLNFSQVTRSSLSLSRVDNNLLVKEVVETIKQANPYTKAEIKLHDLGFCHCDSNLVKQVWINLISNAVKYSKKSDKPFIEIGVEQKEGQVIYYVKDNGVGFDMQYESRLFAVFQRLHSKADFEGTGIGLALAARIITKHQGKIWAKAEINKGAVFYFTLPQ